MDRNELDDLAEKICGVYIILHEKWEQFLAGKEATVSDWQQRIPEFMGTWKSEEFRAIEEYYFFIMGYKNPSVTYDEDELEDMEQDLDVIFSYMILGRKQECWILWGLEHLYKFKKKPIPPNQMRYLAVTIRQRLFGDGD